MVVVAGGGKYVFPRCPISWWRSRCYLGRQQRTAASPPSWRASPAPHHVSVAKTLGSICVCRNILPRWGPIRGGRRRVEALSTTRQRRGSQNAVGERHLFVFRGRRRREVGLAQLVTLRAVVHLEITSGENGSSGRVCAGQCAETREWCASPLPPTILQLSNVQSYDADMGTGDIRLLPNANHILVPRRQHGGGEVTRLAAFPGPAVQFLYAL